MSKVLEIDEVDKNIIQIIQKTPNLTHTEIAKKVNRSQPTVGMRIKKLEELGVLKFQAGINIKTADMLIARVELQTTNPEAIEQLVQKCPFMFNAFRLSGNSNMSIFITGFKLKDIENIVNFHFRKNPDISNVVMDIVTGIVNDLVLPFNLNFENCKMFPKEPCCKTFIK